MSDFTFLYRGRDTDASPERMQKRMEKWRAWFGVHLELRWTLPEAPINVHVTPCLSIG
jgi:hypothetical protein